MYLGHSFLAFAIVAAVGHRVTDLDRRRVLLLAALAAGYGILPDVDTWRTLYVFLREGPEGVFPMEHYVWQYSWMVHRQLTHSVVTGSAATVVSGLAALSLQRDGDLLRVGSAVALAGAIGGLLFAALHTAGSIGAATMALFLAGAVGLAVTGRARGATALHVTAVAGVGLLTHPFGDFWMGQPPAILAPLVSEPPFDEVFLSSDPVLHYIGAVGVEVALLAVCVHLVCTLTGRDTRAYLSPLALLGLGYAGALGRVPPPTFAEAYQFAGGLFALSVLVVLAVSLFDPREEAAGTRARALFTGVVAFGLGLVAYAAAYALPA